MDYWDEEDTRTYTVLMNDEEQYSLWVASHQIPSGWRRLNITGTKAECLAFVDANWTDMRPLSLRKQMEGQH